ncbi:uncharacterized protein LOC122753087 isoform X2 [Dromiciops gliroides]|uniref:uncharacterized protein LOC122753087 isoform X2 n=1 Tax=Dromiciops gliroides TaxID=33562 RepID=UPI001CC768B2|nr:uncharacterized protein LOC122753087 isoform X2 [Dromiciops gliroides]
MASGLFLRKTVVLWFFFNLFSVIINSEFATFKCQENVSVCQNDRVEIICNTTKKFDDITLMCSKDKKDTGKQLFYMNTVGDSPFQDGMKLVFGEQVAKLVIQNAQISHDGFYRWILTGEGSQIKFTHLHVSGSPTIYKENGNLICRAARVKSGRRIRWSNDLPAEETEYTSDQDASGLFNLSSSQLWDDSFDSNPPCCEVVDEKGSQEFCSKTCYTSAIMKEISV